MVRHKADVNAVGKDGDTLLLNAAKNSDVPMVKLLLEHQADVNIRGRDGKTVHDLTTNASISELIKNITPKGPRSSS